MPRFTHCKLLDLSGSAVWTPIVTDTFLSRLLTGLGVKQRNLRGSEGSQAQPLSPENPECQAGGWPGDITRRPRAGVDENLPVVRAESPGVRD